MALNQTSKNRALVSFMLFLMLIIAIIKWVNYYKKANQYYMQTQEPLILTWAITLVIFLIAFLGAFAVQRRRVFRHSSINFRTSILILLRGLYPNPVSFPTTLEGIDIRLREIFIPLKGEVAKFKLALPKRNHKAFDKAWFNYTCGGEFSEHTKTHEQCYNQYVSFNNHDGFQKFKDNVDSLLSFTQ